jgi:hypothetical protein
MADKKAAPGMTEIWSRRGVTDRFVCREPEDETEEIQEPLEPFEQ